MRGPCSGAHPASCSIGMGALSLGVKRQEREANHSPPCSADFKNAYSYTSTPLIVLMAWCLSKQWIRLQVIILS